MAKKKNTKKKKNSKKKTKKNYQAKKKNYQTKQKAKTKNIQQKKEAKKDNNKETNDFLGTLEKNIPKKEKPKEELKNNPKKAKRKWKRIIFYLIFITALISLSYSLYHIINWNKDNQYLEKITEEVIDKVPVTEINEEVTETTMINEPQSETDIYWKYKDISLIDVDIKKLKEENNDTIGWIQVLGTNINYPIVQSNDNSYYLNHDYLKRRNDGGWIFLDYRNNLDNLQENNIIYGHRRYNQSMFGTLKNVLTRAWQNNTNNHIIKISSAKNNYLFQVFSIYTIPKESYYIQTEFNETNSFQTFITTIKDRSIYNFNTEVNANDKVLTLSTCHGDGDRLVVHAKLIKMSTK